MSPTASIRVCGLLLASVAASVPAAEVGDKTEQRRWSPDSYEAPWQEGVAETPAPPQEVNLALVHTPSLDSPYEVLIDRRSVSLLPDKVFRYTAVLEAPSGTRNVFFEGIRCDTKDFKIYAYLSGGGFRVRRDAQWQPIHRDGPSGYRAVLLKEFVCRESGVPADLDQIEARLERGDREARRGLNLRARDPRRDQKF